MNAASRFLVALALLGTVIAVISVRSKSRTQSALSSQNLPAEGRLLQSVQQAKAEGKKKVYQLPPIVEYVGGATTNTLDSLAPGHGIVIAEPISINIAHSRGDTIVTWYKFREVETLAAQSKPECYTCSSISLPPEFQELKEDEFVIGQYGGSLTIDDIEVAVGYEYPPFQIGKRYILVISKEASSGKASLIGGSAGAFNLTGSGVITSIDESNVYTEKAIKDTYNNSLENLRAKLKAKNPSSLQDKK